MRCGSSPRAAHSSSRFQSSWPCRSPASTLRSGWCSGRSCCVGSRSRSAVTSTIRSGDRAGTSCLRPRMSCSRSCLAPHSGNVIRGVPIDGSGMFSMSLFTDFTARGRVGILDWYTLSVAVFATVLLSAHGATYLRLKTVGPVHERSERLARLLWLITAALFVVVSVETSVVRPELFQALLQRPLAWMSVDRDRCGGLGVVDRTARTSREPSLCRVVRRDCRPAGRRRRRASFPWFFTRRCRPNTR